MNTLSDLSYLHTPPVHPYKYTTVTQITRDNARLRPNHELLILRELDGSRSSLTNASLYQQAEQLARYLLTQGVKRGDTVALVGPNSLEMAIGTLGIMVAGGVVLNVTINMKTALDFKAQFEHAHAKFILVDCGKNNSLLLPVKTMLEHCTIQTESETCEDKIKVIFLRKTDSHDFKMTETLENIQSSKVDHVTLPHIYPEDNAIIFTTSGSTGKPKIVCYTHFNIVNSTTSITPHTPDYQIIIFSEKSFQWISGSLLFNIVRNETRVLMDSAITMNSQNAGCLWRILKEEKCTDASVPPYVIHDLLELPKQDTDDGFRLKHILTTGQMIDNSYTAVIGRLCQKMVIVYGSTESSRITFNGPLDGSEPLTVGDVGRPCPGVEIRVVDDHDFPIKRGLIGNIQIRSPYVMKKYFGNPQLTEEVFTEGKWFRAGDIGKVSSAGNLILLGREVEVISRGTNKIYPGMLESLLKQMELIKDVCVIPVPDRRLHEEVCVCFVSPRHVTPEDVKKFFEQKLFREHTLDSLGDMPTYFLRFSAFPKLRSGKPDRKAIRLDATMRLELAAASSNGN